MKQLVISLVLVGVLPGGAARAQSPEEEWGGFEPPPATAQPVELEPARPAPLPAAPPPMSPPPAYAPVAPGPVAPRPEVLARVRPPQERNAISVYGATPLTAGKRGQSVTMGFPLLDIRALFGVTDRLDLGIGFNSYFFMMNEPKALVRFAFLKGDTVSLGAQLEAGYAFFTQRATVESRSSRWLSGHRNVNVTPSLVLSIQGDRPRAPRVFFDAHYMLTLDFEGFASSPLGGIPPAVIPGHNGGVRGGAELPLSSKTSFVFQFGLDIHGREEDSPVMPSGSLGLVTSL